MSYVTRQATPEERTKGIAKLRAMGKDTIADLVASGVTRMSVSERVSDQAPVTKSAPVAPVFTFLEQTNADGSTSVVKLDASGKEVSRIHGSPAASLEEFDFMGNPSLVERVNPVNLENRQVDGLDFAAAIDARNDDADELEIA